MFVNIPINTYMHNTTKTQKPSQCAIIFHYNKIVLNKFIIFEMKLLLNI